MVSAQVTMRIEFQSVGVSKRERGRRTDEALEVIRRLLSEDEVHHEGKYYPLEGVSIYPTAGADESPFGLEEDHKFMLLIILICQLWFQQCLDRIARHEGWICRSSGTSPEIVKRDVNAVVERIKQKRSTKDFTVAHAQWLHIVESTNREIVIEEQLKAYRGVMDTLNGRMKIFKVPICLGQLKR